MASFTLDGETYDYLTPDGGDPEQIHSWEYGAYPKVKAVIPLTNRGTVTVYGHAQRWSPTHTVRLHRSSGSIDLMKRVAGANTVIATQVVATTAGRRYRLRADIYGAEVKVYLDGTLILTHTLTGGDETTFAAQTKHGLRSNVSTTARFDSFRVLSLV